MGEPSSIDESVVSRKRYEGVRNVIGFNWPMYSGAAVVYTLLLAAAAVVPSQVLKQYFVMAAGIPAYFAVVSLLVSYWVYDCSNLYKFDWFVKLLPSPPARILNLHAGFDEASAYLKLRFPAAQLKVFDFYSPSTSTESSMARARVANQATSTAPLSVGLNNWNLPDGSQDLVVIFLAAHELRKGTDRDRFFAEVYRVLSSGGRCVLVEHQRDLPNFLAYGIGFLHFLPHKEWLRTIGTAGFKLAQQTNITPFIKVFCLCK